MMLSSLLHTPLFGITLTLVTYELATCIYRRWPVAFFNPVILTAGFIIWLLSFFEIPYAEYAKGGDMLLFLLGPAVVALGVPLYQRRAEIIARLIPTLSAVTAGALASIVSAVGILMLFGSDTDMLLSMAPKSVTTPIAIGIADKIGGIVPLTAAIVVITGCFGAMVGPEFCRLLKIKDPFAMGLAMGTAAHGLGTGRMLEIDRFGGAMAGLAIGLNGVITAAIIPMFVALLDII
jgi:predicted murein hydrolase (TIGR00659 family)